MLFVKRTAFSDMERRNGHEKRNSTADTENGEEGAPVNRRRRRARPSLPFAVLAIAVVAALFAVTISTDIDCNTELPKVTATPPPVERVTPSAPAASTPAPTPEATPAPYIPDEADVEMLARVIWGEARGVPSDMEKAAVVWCILNRVDADGWPDTVAEVVTQPYQFAGYSPDYPATEELKAVAADVLTRWEREKQGGGDVGRVLPAEYVFFTGDGAHNHFRTEYRGGTFWDWSLKNPYSS